jgi:hypothetical protein
VDKPKCPYCGHDVDWVTIKEAAKAIDRSVQRVAQLIDEGRLPGSEKSTTRPVFYRVPVASIVAYLIAREATDE